MAEEVGFEPTRAVNPGCSQDSCHKPLGHSSNSWGDQDLNLKTPVVGTGRYTIRVSPHVSPQLRDSLLTEGLCAYSFSTSIILSPPDLDRLSTPE